jgi:hypothetical protein
VLDDLSQLMAKTKVSSSAMRKSTVTVKKEASTTSFQTSVSPVAIEATPRNLIKGITFGGAESNTPEQQPEAPVSPPDSPSSPSATKNKKNKKNKHKKGGGISFAPTVVSSSADDDAFDPAPREREKEQKGSNEKEEPSVTVSDTTTTPIAQGRVSFVDKKEEDLEDDNESLDWDEELPDDVQVEIGKVTMADRIKLQFSGEDDASWDEEEEEEEEEEAAELGKPTPGQKDSIATMQSPGDNIGWDDVDSILFGQGGEEKGEGSSTATAGFLGRDEQSREAARIRTGSILANSPDRFDPLTSFRENFLFINDSDVPQTFEVVGKEPQVSGGAMNPPWRQQVLVPAHSQVTRTFAAEMTLTAVSAIHPLSLVMSPSWGKGRLGNQRFFAQINGAGNALTGGIKPWPLHAREENLFLQASSIHALRLAHWQESPSETSLPPQTSQQTIPANVL